MVIINIFVKSLVYLVIQQQGLKDNERQMFERMSMRVEDEDPRGKELVKKN